MIGGAMELGTERDSGMALSLVQTVCAIIELRFDNRKTTGNQRVRAARPEHKLRESARSGVRKQDAPGQGLQGGSI
jgi:hypothetical protein